MQHRWLRIERFSKIFSRRWGKHFYYVSVLKFMHPHYLTVRCRCSVRQSILRGDQHPSFDDSWIRRGIEYIRSVYRWCVALTELFFTVVLLFTRSSFWSHLFRLHRNIVLDGPNNLQVRRDDICDHYSFVGGDSWHHRKSSQELGRWDLTYAIVGLKNIGAVSTLIINYHHDSALFRENLIFPLPCWWGYFPGHEWNLPYYLNLFA